jgi:hypothetical protein
MPPARLDVFPFFVGCGRSGTTLIRVIFNAHPQVAIPRESHFIPQIASDRRRLEVAGGVDAGRLLSALEADERFRRWKLPRERVKRRLERALDLPDAIRRLYALHAKRHGKPKYADKTPNYATQLPLLAGLFPEARFVHVIRDGRNVALSLVERSFGPSRTDDAALYWRRQVTEARAAGAALGRERYLEYRHEDLTSDPEGTVRTVCSFLDLGFAPEMLRYHEGRRPGSTFHRHLAKPPTAGLRDYRAHLGPVDVRTIELLAGALLADLGYDVGAALAPADEARARRRAAAARARHAGFRAADRVRSSRAARALRRRLASRG